MKVHLARIEGSDRQGVWCNRELTIYRNGIAIPIDRYVLTKHIS